MRGFALAASRSASSNFRVEVNRTVRTAGMAIVTLGMTVRGR
jgi:hypothetical protein